MSNSFYLHLLTGLLSNTPVAYPDVALHTSDTDLCVFVYASLLHSGTPRLVLSDLVLTSTVNLNCHFFFIFWQPVIVGAVYQGLEPSSADSS